MNYIDRDEAFYAFIKQSTHQHHRDLLAKWDEINDLLTRALNTGSKREQKRLYAQIDTVLQWFEQNKRTVAIVEGLLGHKTYRVDPYESEIDAVRQFIFKTNKDTFSKTIDANRRALMQLMSEICDMFSIPVYLDFDVLEIDTLTEDALEKIGEVRTLVRLIAEQERVYMNVCILPFFSK